jgi:hypothetical protein
MILISCVFFASTQVLIERGASVTAINDAGATALSMATECRCDQLIPTLEHVEKEVSWVSRYKATLIWWRCCLGAKAKARGGVGTSATAPD